VPSTADDIALSAAMDAASALGPETLLGLTTGNDNLIDCDILSLEKLRRSELSQDSADLARSKLKSQVSNCAKSDTVLSINSTFVQPAEAAADDLGQGNKLTAIRE
jgi:hypothetical protein